ncbi:MAG: hypothetical protein JHC95_08115 [Solirubrobacteraceae bacterium]|nr:hypothetical protein [Solirubrobacteraceae bacterium]
MRASDTHTPQRARRRRLLGLLAAGTLAAGATAAPAGAATDFQCIGPVGATPTADNVIPSSDLELRVVGTADFGDVVVGQKFSYAPTVQYSLTNAYLKRLGESGYLADGENKLGGITFWVAIKAANTLEERQVLRGVVNPTANTRVIWDAAAKTVKVQRYTNAGVANGPATPDLAGSTNLNTTEVSWTPLTASPVSFSVAPGGSLGEFSVKSQWRKATSTASDPQDSVFNSPAVPDVDPLETVRPYGGFYARVRIGNAAGSEGRTSLDCVGGSAHLLNDTVVYKERGNVLPADGGDRGRYTVLAAPSTSFASVTPDAQTRPFTCIDGLGRYISREINGWDIALSTGALPQFTAGQGYSLSGAKLDVTVGSPMIKGLYNNLSAYQVLPPDGILRQDFTLWVQIKASNTAEGTQLVKIDSEWTAKFIDPDGVPGSGDERYPASKLKFDVPATSWTPTGAGNVEFTVGDPGQIPELTLVGRGHAGAAGAVFPMYPYGSLFIRAETGRYGASIDCVEGDVSIADSSIGFSNLGRRSPDLKIPTPVAAGAPPATTTVSAGSAGRYAITHKPKAAFATATPVPVAAQAVAAAATPVAPKPVAPQLKVTGLAKGLLTIKRNKLSVAVSCPASAATCTGKLALKSASKVKLRKRGKAAIRTLAGTKAYSVAAGKTATVTLNLSQAGKTLLSSKKKLAAVLTVSPNGAKAVTTKLTLKK